MLVCGQYPPRWSSGEVKCSACSREEGTLQRLGEIVSFLVCSADLGESDMSCLDLLLKIFVLDIEMLAQFCHAVGVCDIDASLVVNAQGNGADAVNLFSVNDLTLRIIVDTEGCGAERDLPCAAEILEPGEIPGGDVGVGDKFSLCG
jgi:hypothetical protein